MPAEPTATTLSDVQNIIAEITGYEPNDIQPHFDLEDDLQLNMETDFLAVIKRINTHFGTHFKAKEIAEDVETVGHLVDMVEDETELG